MSLSAIANRRGDLQNKPIRNLMMMGVNRVKIHSQTRMYLELDCVTDRRRSLFARQKGIERAGQSPML